MRRRSVADPDPHTVLRALRTRIKRGASPPLATLSHDELAAAGTLIARGEAMIGEAACRPVLLADLDAGDGVAERVMGIARGLMRKPAETKPRTAVAAPAVAMAQGDFVLDLAEERLRKAGRPVPLTNKAFQLLRLFAESGNRLLTKDEILDRIWGDVHVSDALVREYVHDVRVALEDDPRAPRHIETVPRRGYRFIGGVAVRGGDGARASEPPTLAILPFEAIGGERTERLARGLADDLVTDLARFPDLRVAKRDSVEGGTGPPADYALEGTVQIAGDAVRINLRLREAGSARYVWSNRYDREIGGFLAVQSEVTARVTEALGGMTGLIGFAERARLARRPPGDLAAYELYLLALDLELSFSREAVLYALSLIERAVEMEPGFARGWLVLGWVCWQIAMEGWAPDPDRFRRRCLEAYRRGARLDPLDPVGQLELSAARALADDLPGCRAALERCLDLARHQGDVRMSAANYVASLLDQPTRALGIVDATLPLLAGVSRFHRLSEARVACFAGEYARALKVLPGCPDTLQSRLFRALAAGALGREAECRKAAEAVRRRAPGFDPRAYLMDHPVTGPRMAAFVLRGSARAGLGTA